MGCAHDPVLGHGWPNTLLDPMRADAALHAHPSWPLEPAPLHPIPPRTHPCAAFRQLCELDKRYEAFQSTLFSPSSITLDRSQQSVGVGAGIDAAVTRLCTLLSSSFLLPPAFPVLEYLLRRYAVHEHNVDSLMLAALPFHATNQFVRLVQLLRLRGTLFEFLEPMQESGAALPRSTLVLRCITDKVGQRV